MPKKINLNVSMNWFQTSEISEDGQNKTKTFAGSAPVGGNSASSINVQINLPALSSNDFTFMLAQPVGTSTLGTEAFSTRVVRITPGPNGSANIHIRRVDKAGGWDMKLQLNLLLISVGTS